MIPANFEYHRPGSIDEAISLLTEHGEDGRVLAGGHSLIPMMKLRLAEPGHLIDLNGVEGLRSIAEVEGAIHIGAMTTQAEIIASDDLAARCPILREAAKLIADPQVRACGTIGGNVANGDPGNDLPAVMMALDASFVLRGPGGERSLAARGFYEGPFETARDDDEILTALRLPALAAGQGQAYCKLKRKVGDYAIAAAAVVLAMDGGACSQAAVALTNVGITPLYAEAASAALTGTAVDAAAVEAAVEAAVAITDPAADLRGPVEYRRHAAGVMTRRAIETALARATGG
ncbi:MAG: xanthine dehydrogenase family protein subunit M [Proteobacteria bacterium]|nr:xanthine dehydrogenase family protein subunit M [Pseudomonadota bacterium]